MVEEPCPVIKNEQTHQGSDGDGEVLGSPDIE